MADGGEAGVGQDQDQDRVLARHPDHHDVDGRGEMRWFLGDSDGV